MERASILLSIRGTRCGHEETVDDGLYIVDNLSLSAINCKLLTQGRPRCHSTHERHAQFWKRNLADKLLPSVPLSASLRNVQASDISALGLLFFAAFHGTIDNDGQTVTQYTSKARAIVGGSYGEWVADASWAVERTEGLQSACLVCDYRPYGCPVIAVVATAPASKMSGIAGSLLDAALASLLALGRQECCAMITKGNVASERLFESRGFSIL